jgi:hypothetical protein
VMATTTRYCVTLPRKGTVTVKAYTSSWALCQAENTLHCSVQWGWVRQIVGKRKLRAEKVYTYHGVGR